jgi:hypothetical protein
MLRSTSMTMLFFPDGCCQLLHLAIRLGSLRALVQPSLVGAPVILQLILADESLRIVRLHFRHREGFH